MAEALLSAEDLRFGHAAPLLADPVSFRVGPGDVLVVLGPNGAGKTTLFRTLIGALRPLSGSVRWSGDPVGTLPLRVLARRVAYVPQQPDAAFDFTVAQYAMLGRLGRLGAFAGPGPEDRGAVEDAIARLGLESFRDRPLGRMSGGERQMAAIARALAQQAGVLILDEPTGGLDFANQARVLDTLAALASEGLGIVYSTHDPNHALRAGTAALLYRADRRCEYGEVESLTRPERLSEAYRADIERAVSDSGQTVIALARPRR